MLQAFFIHALLGGIGVAMIAGPLGCFIVWRRMAYFGDALSHAALLGVTIGIALNINITVAILMISVIFSLAVIYLTTKRQYAADTILGILAHSMLAIGLVMVSFMKQVRIDLMSLLFGDILAINHTDIIIIFAGAIISLLWLSAIWRKLLLITINKDIAATQGINILAIELQFTLLISILVAVSIKIIGILLITSLLIIPAAAARPFAKVPEQMAIYAALIGIVSVIAGLFGSFTWDSPSGPSIIVAGLGCFIIINFAHYFVKNLNPASRSRIKSPGSSRPA